MALYQHMTVIGVGLLGGSLARVAKEKNLASRVTGFGRNEETLKRAVAEGVIDDYKTRIAEAVQGADLVVLCSPVGTFVPRLEEMRDALSPGCHVTDVGSVKGDLVRQLEERMPEGVFYVGAHPMAGSEQSGLEASCADLYDGARCIVTPTEKTEASALEKVSTLWRGCGMEVVVLDPDEHDQILAAVSHMPHVVAYALMNTVATMKTEHHDDVFPFSAGGLRDVTRIAASDPVMWKDICLLNRAEVLNLIDRFQKNLDILRDAIENSEAETMQADFNRAREYRSRLAGMNE